jgi:putative transposase
VGTHPRLGKETSACETRKTTAAQRGDYRQPIGENDGKKGVCCGYDAGKKVKGRKRHLLVDTLGLIWGLVVHAADVQDRDGAKLVLEQARGRFSRLKLIWADGGYAGQLIGWVQQICGWVLEIVKRSDDVTGFVVLPKRWIVERTFGWFGWYRRLSKDYEELTESSEAMILVCMIHRMLRHLKPGELAVGWEK